MTKYAIIKNGIVTNVVKADADFASSQGWVEVTGAFEPGDLYDAENGFSKAPPAPEPVPQAVTMFQARAQLSRAGLLASVEAAIAQAGGEAALAWEYALELRRDSPTVVNMASALGLTEAQIDDLFRTAAGITA